MNVSIFEKFQNLPICFEYFYKQLTALAYEKITTDKIDELEMVSNALQLKREETLVLAVIFHLQHQKYPVDVEVVNRLVAPVIGKNSDVFDIVHLFRKLDVLEKEDGSMVKIVRFSSYYFKLIKENKIESLRKIKPIGLIPMLHYLNVNILHKRFQSFRSIMNELEFLSELNPDLALVKNIFLREDTISALIVGAICAKQLHERTSFNTSFISHYIVDYMGEVHYIVKSIAQGDWEYIQKGWVKITGDGLMTNEVNLELDKAGISQWMPELSPEQMREILIKEDAFWSNLIKPESITPLEMYFNENMQTNIRNLEGLCQLDFKSMAIDNLELKGASVLLYGAPGTGKTELALQLARMSGRSLFRVEVNQIMSKWVGESEQKLKESLNRYKRMARSMDVPPILFLNECDQILSKRVAINNSVDQMHNNLQNILLEEFENFEGLLFATTNLTNNLDVAFERRFLYKVQFEKPSTEIQLKIWKQYLPQFSIEQLNQLLNRFEFTAAEIKNISKKLALSNLMGAKIDPFQLALSFCQNEYLDSNRINRIGF